MIRALEVIWIDDHLIRPPGPKMVVCVEPYLGFFFRINSHDNWQPCVSLPREPHHRFLKHDSHIECTILDLDDHLIGQAIRRNGILGRVHPSLCPPLLDVLGQTLGSRNDLRAIRQVLESHR